MELDFSFGIKAVCARFRCNVFNQRGAVGAVYRLIPEKIRTFGELGLPPVLANLAERPRGLVLVTGPTGSGKSTTLAAMIDKINSERHEHILTIEDPIEYIHQHKNCLVNQREVHSDTNSFAHALRAALREDPGHRPDRRNARPRDRRSGAEDRRDRPPDVRHAAHQLGGADDQPHHRRLPVATSRRRSAPSSRSCSRASSVRRCCRGPTARGGSCSLEIMVPTPAIRNLIRDDKVHQIYGAMQAGQEKLGMQTANQSLASLYMKRADHARDGAWPRRRCKDELQDMINRGVGVVGRRAGWRTVAAGTAAPRRPAADSGTGAKPCRHLPIPDGRARDRPSAASAPPTRWMRGRRAAPRADQRHPDHAGQGEGRRRRQEAEAGKMRQEGRRQEPGGLHAAVLGDDRRRPAAGAVPRHSRHAGRRQELRRRHPADARRTSSRARRSPTRCASTRRRSIRCSPT